MLRRCVLCRQVSFEAIKAWDWFPASTWESVWGTGHDTLTVRTKGIVDSTKKPHHFVGLVDFLTQLKIRNGKRHLLDEILWEKVASWMSLPQDCVIKQRGASIRVVSWGSRFPPPDSRPPV